MVNVFKSSPFLNFQGAASSYSYVELRSTQVNSSLQLATDGQMCRIQTNCKINHHICICIASWIRGEEILSSSVLHQRSSHSRRSLPASWNCDHLQYCNINCEATSHIMLLPESQLLSSKCWQRKGSKLFIFFMKIWPRPKLLSCGWKRNTNITPSQIGNHRYKKS